MSGSTGILNPVDEEEVREKKKIGAAEYYAANSEHVNERVKDYRKRLPHKRSAHLAVKRAMYAGTLNRPDTCVGDIGLRQEECDRTPEAHHDNYTEQLVVIWLCRRHHRQRHEHLRSQGIDPD